MNDGQIALVSSDDAINGVSLDIAATSATATADSTTTTATTWGGRGGGTGGGMPGETGNAQLTISGGHIVIDAGGDGIDINGNVDMTGGTVIVNGPTDNSNGALDYVSGFKVTGGYLVAAGSSGMAEAPSETSTQYSIMVNFTEAQAVGTVVRIEDKDGKSVFTVAPTKQFQSIVLCSSDLKEGATYTVYLGDTEYATLTLASIVTLSGSAGMMGGGMGGGRPDGDTSGTGGGPGGA